jgi:hypothetical protein
MTDQRPARIVHVTFEARPDQIKALAEKLFEETAFGRLIVLAAGGQAGANRGIGGQDEGQIDAETAKSEGGSRG